ncbi:MAG: hypothetical protein U0289_06155 [Cyclobacteriaceae bacterium]|nr:hypothetical protein [Cytophagales bacterium]HNP77529.1 hypothetical protein [Cyclobacteriaceae bacterium]
MLKEITLDKFGTLKFFRKGKDHYWFGRVRNIFPDHEVELTIHVKDHEPPSTMQVNLIADFAQSHDKLMLMLYEYLHESFALAGDNRSVNDLRKMYFLSSVELKADNKEWWIVLEPGLNVDSKHNFLPRFTVREGRVTWSNLR